MTWPLENVVRIRALERERRRRQTDRANCSSSARSQDDEGDGDAAGGARATATKSWVGELAVRHLRLCTYLCVTLAAYSTWPVEAAAEGFRFHWVAEVVLRNFFVEALFFGGWHWFLYDRPSSVLPTLKFNGKNQYADGGENLSREKFYTTLGFCMSSLYEVVVLRLWASGSPLLRPYYAEFWRFPAYSIFHILVVAYWRDFHFYFAHRVMHPWRFEVFGLFDPGAVLYRHVHSLHHKSHNPGPWSGLSMHPVEHLVYYTCTLLCVFFSLHPVHFLFNKFHADLSPIAGHDGHDQPAGGSKFHFIHHSKFEYNYGTPMVPLDVWFGTYEDGSRFEGRTKG